MGVPTITSTALIRHTSTATVKKETIPIIWYLFFFLLFYLIFFHTLFRVGDISSSSRSGQNVIGMKWSGKFNQNSFSLSGSKMKEKHCIWVKGMEGGGGGRKKRTEYNISSIWVTWQTEAFHLCCASSFEKFLQTFSVSVWIPNSMCCSALMLHGSQVASCGN